MSEIKPSMVESRLDRLDIAKVRISNVDDAVEETSQNMTHREKKRKHG